MFFFHETRAGVVIVGSTTKSWARSEKVVGACARLSVWDNGRRTNMKRESPEQKWSRLQLQYQDAVEASHPKPERCNCPGNRGPYGSCYPIGV